MQERPYWNLEMEPLLNTSQMKEIQLEKIKKLVKRLYETKSFWRERMDKAKAKPENIKSLDVKNSNIPAMHYGKLKGFLRQQKNAIAPMPQEDYQALRAAFDKKAAHLSEEEDADST